MRSFVIRPFGIKRRIDFDAVEEKLIAPALCAIGAEGGTTGEIIYAGNIRKDMFELLLQADLVVADITFHNANVFYELGVRHAYRARTTVMIRGSGGDKHVFDLSTDRYFTYDSSAPDTGIDGLVEVLKRSLANDQDDSPVLSLVPRAARPQTADLIMPHREFIDEVQHATPHHLRDGVTPEVAAMRGHLVLLGEESQRRTWGLAGQRLVARALWSAKMFRAARDLTEQVRRSLPMDREANEMLATLYGHLGDLTASNIAIDRVLAEKPAPTSEDAELLSRRGANFKSRWRNSWAEEKQKSNIAILSPALDDAIAAYSTAFDLNLNHHSSGINALTLRVIKRELARRHPEEWKSLCYPGDPEDELATIDAEIATMTPAARLAIASAFRNANDEEATWLALSHAEVELMTGKEDAAEKAYLRALRMTAIKPFQVSSAKNQLEMLKTLNVREEQVDKVLQHFAGDAEDPTPRPIWLFVGHMVDAPDRKKPRFPNTAEAEAAVAEALHATFQKQIEEGRKPEVAFSSLASGGDILFQEIMRKKFEVDAHILLGLDRNVYARHSVQPAGERWMERYGELLAEKKPLSLDIYARDAVLPNWLIDAEDYSVWQRNNRWLLHTALSYGPERVRIFALWDGKSGDDLDGTGDMVRECRRRGLAVEVLSLPEILESVVESDGDGNDRS